MASLSAQEQVSRGHVLLQLLQKENTSMLKEDSLSSSRCIQNKEVDVDVKVIVKRTFIEVIDPRNSRLSRSMSDSMILTTSSGAEQPWQKVTAEKSWDTRDLSDASTSICSDSEEPVEFVPTRTRADTCWSDDEGNFDSSAQQCVPFQYVEYDPNAPMMWWMMPDGSAMMGHQWPSQSSSEGECAHTKAQWSEKTLDDASSLEWRTTVMLRNMPNNYTREMVLDLVDDMGFEGCYDFAYLPVDFKTQAGLGYAFLNFVTPSEALRCFQCFEGFRDWIVPSEKVCTVTWGAPYQGLEAHIERYQNSPIMHHSILDEWKPILLERGVRVPFPPPTRPIKTPKVRQQYSAN